MPTYEYACGKCGHHFEIWQKITEEPLIKCPVKKCRGRVNRLIGGGAGFILKGNGFYATDYRSSDYKKQSNSEKSASSEKTTPAEKTTPSAKPETPAAPAKAKKGEKAAA